MSQSRRVRLPRAMVSRVVALAAALLALFAAGCSTGGTSSSSVGHYTVRVSTPLYRYGPAQSFGPDFSLPPGQHVIMLKKEYGYSRVMTDDGQSGYVASEDLAVAPPPPPPPKTSSGTIARAPRSGRGGGRSRTNSPSAPVIQGSPLFGEGELPPLPEKDPLQPPADFRANVPAPAPASGTNGETNSKPGFRVRVKSDETR